MLASLWHFFTFLQLPKFFYLCEDGVWGVRKACADVFMPVSCVCSPSVRHTELSPLFINLLRDSSRWVRLAAFQALGPFISTFADPSITALLHNDNGEIVVTEPDTLANTLDQLEEERELERLERKKKEEETKQKPVIDDGAMDVSDDEDGGGSLSSEDIKDLSVEERRAEAYQKAKAELVQKEDPVVAEVSQEFNNFHFWREPLMSIEEDVEMMETETNQDAAANDKQG